MLTGCLYGVRKNFLLFMYVVSFAAAGMLLVLVLEDLNVFSPKILLFVGMVYAIVSTIGWALFSTTLDISGVAGEFDRIKNDIALKEISDPEHFARSVIKLLCNYFRFSFFTIPYAFAQIIGTDPVFSDDTICYGIDRSVIAEIERNARNSEDVFYMSAYEINSTKYHLYVIPIWFAGEYLGCIGVFTTKKLIKLFVRFLTDLEKHYIDDQLFHVLNR